MTFSWPGSGSRGFTARAESIEEIHTAIDHYLKGHGNVERPDCPLCRLATVSRALFDKMLR